MGLLLGLSFRKRRVHRGVLLCEGASWPRKLGWKKHRAITFGHVVLCVDDMDDKTMGHELVHVSQYERWGVAFWPAYLLSSARARLRGGDAYRDNRFEKEARERSGG